MMFLLGSVPDPVLPGVSHQKYEDIKSHFLNDFIIVTTQPN